MGLLILHLSDIHIATPKDDILRRANAIAQATFKDLSLAEALVVAVTGDIAYSGTREQYIAAKAFLSQMIATIRAERDIPIHVLMCQGNHDCDFDAGTPDVRNAVLDALSKTKPDDIKPSLIDVCVEVQAAFFAFRSELEGDITGAGDKLWVTYKIPVGDRCVVFHCINVAWMSKKKEPAASILYPTERYEALANATTDTTVLCMHHPINWFAQPSYRSFKRLIRRAAHLILSGHEHQQAASETDETGNGESVSIDGGVLQEAGREDSSFNLVLLDLDTQEYSVGFHQWDGSRYVPVELEAAWSSFRRLPEKRKSEFSLTTEFSRWLRDAGARFTHQGKHGQPTELVLEDVYVFPELRPFEDEQRDRLVVDSRTLLSPENLSNGVLVKGREQFGKTALLRMLFLSYYERAYLPIVLSGKEISKATPRDMQKTIESAVARIYGKDDVGKFWQAGADSRILLLDDFDEVRVSGHFLSRAIEYLKKTFPLMVVTASELFNLRELIATGGESSIQELDHFEILEFGYRRRLDLIKKWAKLSEQNYSLDRLVSAIDQAERIATGVIGEGVVPSTPFFLLTILQSIESGSSNLQQSALGDYYTYLIIHSLEVQRIARDEYGEILNYCAHLGWFLFNKSDHKASAPEFEQFHKAFVERHALATKFDGRRDLLLNAHLMSYADGLFGFRYPYLFYYFLGKYLAEHIEDEEVQQIVRDCCEELYKQDNGNVILFLAHHSRDSRVYDSVVSVLQRHYSGEAPMRLEKDIEVINKLVERAPQLVFIDGDVMDKRDAVRKEQDASDETRQAMMADPDALPSELKELLSLMKTIDILGQFLKNHYGQLEAATKERLLRELLDGGMRGLQGVLKYLVADPDALVRSIESYLEKRGLEKDPARRSERAKREMFVALSALCHGFVYRCGVAIASPHLMPVIDNVVAACPSIAFRLMRAGIDLERQGGLDELALLHRLNEDVQTNAVAQSVLQRMVLGHMHLYATKLIQKQKVCQELNIKLEDQRALDFKTRYSKRIGGT